jgi:protocatechuate 3,4-dioxygenase beta subunit
LDAKSRWHGQSPATGFSRQAVTNNTGNYDFPGLQPGTYNVRTEAPGFSAETRTDVELQVQQVARIDFHLCLLGDA